MKWETFEFSKADWRLNIDKKQPQEHGGKTYTPLWKQRDKVHLKSNDKHNLQM